MIRQLPFIAAAFALVCQTPADAKVQSVSEHGFAVEESVIVKASPERVYAALGKIGAWWDSAHSWSGSAANMTLALRVGGCFCERLPKDNGMVEHGRVIFAHPGRVLRLSALLGPMQMEGVAGRLSWTLSPADGGTKVTSAYVVGGYLRMGALQIAPLVDGVMKSQLERLKAFVERR